MKKSIFLVFLIFSFSCKTSKFEKYKKSNIVIEDTMFKNSKSELSSIYSIYKSLEQEKTVLVIFNGKKMNFGEFKKKIEEIKKIDSTYIINIIKEKNIIRKYNKNDRWKTLIIIKKNS